MHNLHYTLASLPEIVFNKQNILIDWEILTEKLYNALSKKGKIQLQIIYLQQIIKEIEKHIHSDLRQILNINSTGNKLPPFSRSTIEELTQSKTVRNKLDGLTQLKNLSISQNTLGKETLLGKWTGFECKVDIVCLGLYCQKTNRKPEMGQLFQSRFVKDVFHGRYDPKNIRADFPYSTNITAEFNKGSYSDFEKYILQLKWDYIDSFTSVEPFSTDSAISYCIKHTLYSRKVDIENSFDSGRFDLKLL